MKERSEDQELAVVFGGNWMPLPPVGPDEADRAAASVARGEGGSHFVVVETSREAMVGSTKGKFSAGTRLAGQLLASVGGADELSTLASVDRTMPNNTFRSQTMLYVGEHMNNERVAVAVLNGVPVLDMVGELSAVLHEAQRFMEKIVGGGMLLVQKSVEDDFASLMNAAPSATRLVEGLPFDAQWKARTPALRPVGVSRARLAVLAGALGIVVAPAGMQAYRWYTQSQAIKAAAQRAALERANASNVLQKLQAEALGLTSLARAGAAAHMAFDFARGLLDERGGFALEKLALSPKESQAVYTRRNKRHTFQDFVTETDDGTPSFDVSKLDTGSVIYKALPWDKVPVIDLADPENGSSALLDMGTLAQRSEAVEIKLAISPAAAVLTKEQLSHVDEGTLAKVGRKAGTWTATGPVDLFVPLMDSLPAKACTLSQVEFRFSRDQRGVPADTFNASGRWIVGWS